MIYLNTLDQIADRARHQGSSGRADFIAWLLQSEWWPEYMAGARVAAENIDGPDAENLRSFIMENITDGHPQRGQHVFRHLMTVFPSLVVRSEPQEKITVALPSGRNPGRLEHSAERWRAEFRAHLVHRVFSGTLVAVFHKHGETARLGHVAAALDAVHPDLFNRWLQAEIEKIEAGIEVKERVLARFKDREDKQVGIRRELEELENKREVLDGAGARIENGGDKGGHAAGTRLDRFVKRKNLGAPRGDALSGLFRSDDWSRVSLYVGVAEIADDFEALLLVASTRLAMEELIAEGGLRMDLSALPFALLRLWQRKPACRRAVHRLLPTLCKALPNIGGNTLAGLLYAENLAALAHLCSQPEEKTFPEDKILPVTARIICKHQDCDAGIREQLDQHLDRRDSASARKLQELIRKRMDPALASDPSWRRTQPTTLQLLGWLLICATDLRSNSRAFRMSSKFELLYGLLHAYRYDEDLYQGLVRVIKEFAFLSIADQVPHALASETDLARQLAAVIRGVYGKSPAPDSTEANALGALKALIDAADRARGGITLIESGGMMRASAEARRLASKIEHPKVQEFLRTRGDGWLILRRLVHLNFNRLFPMLREWRFPRTVGKDIGAILGLLLETAERCCGHRTLRSIALHMEHARLERNLAGSLMAFCRSDNVREIVGALTELDRMMVDRTADGRAWKMYRGAEKIVSRIEMHASISPVSFLSDLAFQTHRNACPAEAPLPEWRLPAPMEDPSLKPWQETVFFLLGRAGKQAFYDNIGFRILDDKKPHPQEFSEYQQQLSYSLKERWTVLDAAFREVNMRLAMLDRNTIDDLAVGIDGLNRLHDSLGSLMAWCYEELSPLQRWLVLPAIETLLEQTMKQREETECIWRIVDGENEKGAIEQLSAWTSARSSEPSKPAASHTEKSLRSTIERWMLQRGMLHDLSRNYQAAGTRCWMLFRLIFRLPVVTAVILFPYLVHGAAQRFQGRPSPVSGTIGFELWITTCTALFFMIILSVAWSAVRELMAAGKAGPASDNGDRFALFLPKALGLVFLAFLGLATSEESWGLAASATHNPPVFFLMILFFAAVLYGFIQRVQLRNCNAPSGTLHQRSRVIMSVILLQSFIVVTFFGSLWGGSFSKPVDAVYNNPASVVSAWTEDFFPARVALNRECTWVARLFFTENVPACIYPRIILLWTLQVAFAGIVLQLFFSRERIT